MRTDRLRHNQLSPDAFAWYRRYLAALDAKDVDAFTAFMAEDCEMRFNSDEPVRGRDAIRAAPTAYWSSFATIEHDLLAIYGDDHAFMLEALNYYTLPDGPPLTLRAVALTDRDARGHVTSFRIYTDAAKLG